MNQKIKKSIVTVLAAAILVAPFVHGSYFFGKCYGNYAHNTMGGSEIVPC